MILGVQSSEDQYSILELEPTMVALDFKTIFSKNDIKVTTSWKTEAGWKYEQFIDSDWIDLKGRKIA